jgi:hypothetical protein
MANHDIETLERLIEVGVRALRKERQVLGLYHETAKWAPTELTETLFEMLSMQVEQHVNRLNDTLHVLRTKLEEAKLAQRKKKRASGVRRAVR